MKIHLWLNGKEISDEISPDMPLLEYVRTKGCYSVKRGCETSNLELILQTRAVSSVASVIRDLS